MRLALLALVLSLGFAPGAFAANAGGAGFTYNDATGSIGLNVKNGPDSTSLLTGAQVDFSGTTTIDGTPSGGPSCTTAPSQQRANCVFSPPRPPGQQAFIFINTDGPEPGSIDVTLQFEDGTSVPVVATKCSAIDVSTPTLASATGQSAYSQQLSASGGTGPYTFVYQGVLPAGLSLGGDGLLSGTPTQAGSFTFTVLASDANGCQGSRQYTLTVQPESGSKSADLAVESIMPGIYFRSSESLIQDLNFLSRWYVPVPIADADPYRGFEAFSTWFEGDLAQISVAVSNKGPDAATFNLNVEPPRGAEVTYDGYYVIDFGADINSLSRFSEGTPPPLEPFRSVYLLFSTRFPDAGPLTLSARLTDVSPPDPNLANNAAANTITVSSRTTHRKVAWKPAGAGGDITGTTSPASGSGVAQVAARRRPVEIAVVRRRGGKCAWLTGRSGRLQRRPSAARCPKPVFLRAKGTRRWSYHLKKRPPKGRYSVLVRIRPPSRARAEQQFARSLGNLFAIRIR